MNIGKTFFVTAMMFLTLLALGCASNRRTVISVEAEGSACETSVLSRAAGHARISYRLESGPASEIMQ